MSAPRFTPEVERQICQEYQRSGVTLQQIADKYQTHVSTVSAIRKRHGLKRYLYNMDHERPRKADTPTPVRYACPFCGTKCESPAGHEVCR